MRVHAAIGDLFLPLDTWADGHESAFLALVAKASDRLAARQQVTAEEAAAWIVFGGMPVIWRGDDVLLTAPVVTFGRALVDMAAGTYPAAPPGHEWFFGWPGEVLTVAVASSG
jgi:hypothetical protein